VSDKQQTIRLYYNYQILILTIAIVIIIIIIIFFFFYKGLIEPFIILILLTLYKGLIEHRTLLLLLLLLLNVVKSHTLDNSSSRFIRVLQILRSIIRDPAKYGCNFPEDVSHYILEVGRLYRKYRRYIANIDISVSIPSAL